MRSRCVAEWSALQLMSASECAQANFNQKIREADKAKRDHYPLPPAGNPDPLHEMELIVVVIDDSPLHDVV